MRSRRINTGLLAALLLTALSFSVTHGETVSSPANAPVIMLDADRPGHRVMGFGAQIWTGDKKAEPVLRELGMRYVRMTVGPNWPSVKAEPPTDATRQEMDDFLRAHFDGDGEPRLSRAKQTWEMTDRLGIRVIMIQFTAPENWLSGDGERRLLPDHVDDYARYWGSLIAYMDGHGMRPPYIELSNEPEGDWNTKILPELYDRLVVLTRRELDARGFQDVWIVGPGLAWLDHDDGGETWVNALTPDGVDALAAWSTHTWDEKFQHDAPPRFMIDRWRDFKSAIHRKDPSGNKPVFVTEYATGAVTFNGQTYDGVESGGARPASDSHAYGQRVFEQTLQHINEGASVLIVWEAADQDWSSHTWGLIGRDLDGGRYRPAFHALKTLMPHLSPGAQSLQPIKPDPQVTACGFLTDEGLLIALANGSDTTQARKIQIDNAQGLRVSKAVRYHAGRTADVQLTLIDSHIEVNLPRESTLVCHLRQDEDK